MKITKYADCITFKKKFLFEFFFFENYVVHAHPSDEFDSFDPDRGDIFEEDDRNEDLFEITEENKSRRICSVAILPKGFEGSSPP